MSDGNDQKNRILRLIRESDSPVSIKKVSEHVLGSSGKKEVGLLQNALLGLKTSGQIFEYPPERTGYGVRFGSISPTDWLSNKLVAIVKEPGGRITLNQVRNSLRKWETALLDEAVGKLVKQGKLFYLTVRFKYLLSSPPTPSDHLLPKQVTALREILERVNLHRNKSLTIDEMRAFLDMGNLAKASPIEDFGTPSEELLREWYHRDLSRRGGLSSIPIPWTWVHYESWCRSNKLRPDLEQFQGLMWGLHRTGKIELISHSMTQTLSDRESELSLKSQHGEVFYYWKWR